MLSNPATYEYVEPAKFGRKRSILIGRHSGRAVLRFVLDRIGVKVDDEQLGRLYHTHIASRVNGDCDDLEVLQERLARELATSGSAAGV